MGSLQNASMKQAGKQPPEHDPKVPVKKDVADPSTAGPRLAAGIASDSAAQAGETQTDGAQALA